MKRTHSYPGLHIAVAVCAATRKSQITPGPAKVMTRLKATQARRKACMPVSLSDEDAVGKTDITATSSLYMFPWMTVIISTVRYC